MTAFMNDIPPDLTQLRDLLEGEAYDALRQGVEASWAAQPEPALLPLLAIALAMTGQSEEAEPWLAQALTRAPELDLAGAADLAVALVLAQRLAEAEAVLAPRLHPDCTDSRALQRYAWLLEALDRSAEALPWLERARDARPDDSALQQRCEALQLRLWVLDGAFETAEAWLERRAGADPEADPEAQWVPWTCGYARLLAQQDRHDLAEERLRAAMQRVPQNLMLLTTLAELAQARGRVQVAIGVLRRATRLAPDAVHLWVQLAVTAAPHAEALARRAAERALALTTAGTDAAAGGDAGLATDMAEDRPDTPLAGSSGADRPGVGATQTDATQAGATKSGATKAGATETSTAAPDAAGAGTATPDAAGVVHTPANMTPTRQGGIPQFAASGLPALEGLPGRGEASGLSPARLVYLQALQALAQVESHAGHYDKAEALFEQVLAEWPDCLPALQGLAHQRLQQGRIDAAVALFERVRAIDPVRGQVALINARRFPEDTAILERIEQAAMRPSLEGPVRTGMLFQLAAAWEKQKAYPRAFALAERANTASRAHLRYDAKDHRQRCARIRYAFGKALYDHRQDCGYRGEDAALPVFVVGMPRSGTTLVEQILAGHSRIFGAGELGVIPQRIAGLNRWERRVGSGRTYPDCVDDLSPEVVNGIAEGILKELKELAAEDKPAANQVIDKLPHNFENIGFIKFLFPEAKILSVRRDPRDIAISNYFTDYAAKHGGMGFAYDLTDIGEQLADHNLLMHHWAQLFPGQILEVHYEALIQDPERETRRMLDYLGQPWEPEVLAFNELDRPVKTASVWQVRQPLYRSSSGRWRRYQEHLAPLLRGTNARITWEPIDDMLSLPEPGLLERASGLYKMGRRDDAEYQAKKLLHHIPEHAGASYLVGIIYLDKGYHEEGVALLEQALTRCPWNCDWRADLVRACELIGDAERVARWRRASAAERGTGAAVAEGVSDDHPVAPDAAAAQYPGGAPRPTPLDDLFTAAGSTLAELGFLPD